MKQELQRIRQRLSDSEQETAALASGDALDQFVVSTHLVPRNVNAIPSRLATPLEAEWVQAAMAGPPGGRRRSRDGGDRAPQVAAIHGGGTSASPFSQDAGQYGTAGSMKDEDAHFLDCLDELLGQADQQQFWQQLQSPQSLMYGGRHGSSNMGPLLESPEEKGLYRPVSQLPGPPSLIPRAPHGPPVGHEPSGHPAAAHSSRMAGSFFNGQGGGQQQQQGLLPPPPLARQQQGRPPDSPPILRADHLPSPARKDRRAPPPPAVASRFGGRAGKGPPQPTGAAAGGAGTRGAIPRGGAGRPPPVPGGAVAARAAALPHRGSRTPQLPSIAPSTRPVSGHHAPTPKLASLEGSLPRALSAPSRRGEDSVASLAAAAR